VGDVTKFIYVNDILWISAYGIIIIKLELISGEVDITFKAKF
jgi:hypothetical protein